MQKEHIIDSQTKHMFVVGNLSLFQEDLDERLAGEDISIECSDTVTCCWQALERQPCDLLVIDLERHTEDGLQLLSELQRTAAHVPRLALVDEGDIPTAVQAVRAGASDCLEKPVDPLKLWHAIEILLPDCRSDDRSLRLSLTPVETRVLRLILEGKTTREVAQVLHRSPRTVEVHRSHIMRKLGVSNMVDLVRRASATGLNLARPPRRTR